MPVKRSIFFQHFINTFVLLNVSSLQSGERPKLSIQSFIKVIAGCLDFDTMAGIAATRCAGRALLARCAVKTTRIRGTNRCYGTYVRRTATAAVTVNNEDFTKVSLRTQVQVVWLRRIKRQVHRCERCSFRRTLN